MYINIKELANRKISDKRMKNIKNRLNYLFVNTRNIIYKRRKGFKDGINENSASNLAYRMEWAIEKYWKEILFDISSVIPGQEETHLLNAYQDLMYDMKRVKEIYEKVKDDLSILNQGMTNNIEKNKEYIVAETVELFRIQKQGISIEEMNLLTAYKNSSDYRKAIKKLNTNQVSKAIANKAKYIGKESEVIEELIRESKLTVFNQIKEEYMKALHEIIKVLDSFDFLEEHEKRHNQNQRKLNFEQRKCDIREIFSKENLEKMSLQELISLTSFWSNRLAKLMEDMNSARFIFQDLNLFEEFIKDENEYEKFPDSKISDETLKNEIRKIIVLDKITKSYISKIIEKAITKQEKGKIEINMSEEFWDVYGEYEEKYFEEFKERLPFAENSLEKDVIEKYFTGKNMLINLYKVKDITELALVENCLLRENIENWGYFESEDEKQYIGIAFDVRGLNMPVRLHIEKKLLKHFLRDNGLECKIPVYLGAKDFILNGNVTGTQILYPITEQEKEDLRNYKVDFEKDPQRARFIEHCKYIAEISEFPRHLKKQKIIGKPGKYQKKKTKWVIEKEYIDIYTKERFKLDSNGKYQKLPEEDYR